MSRAYVAGTRNALDQYQVPNSRQGEDSLLNGDYYTIIDNCMDLIRNSPTAKSIVQAMEDYVAGSGLTPNAGTERSRQVWNTWAFGTVDLAGTKTFNQVFRDIVYAIGSTGDVLLTTPIDPTVGNDKVALRLELTSGARVCSPREYSNKKDQYGNTVKFGVAYRDGVEVGYYVKNTDSVGGRDDVSNFRYIEKYDMETGRLNACLIRRPTGMSAEQTRGLSMLTPVFTAIKDLDDLIVSAVQGSRNKALLSVILNSTSPSDAYSGIGAVDPETGELIEAVDDNGEAQIVGSLPDGAIMTAPEGTSAQVINSSGDIDRDALILRALKIVSMGSGIPYEILAKDLSNVNFSGGKLAFDSFFRLTQFWTDELVKVFQEINKWVQIEASLKGFGVEELTSENIALEFIGSQNFVDADPAKNSKAETERMGNNTTTASRILAQKGIQYKQILLEKAQEYLQAQEVAQELDVPLEVVYATNQAEASLGVSEAAKDSEKSTSISMDDLKKSIDAYGVGVRAGAYTPQKEDEGFFRKLLNLPLLSQNANKAWDEVGGVKQPITLQNQDKFDESETEKFESLEI